MAVVSIRKAYPGHAKRVMKGYERWFANKPELCVLRMLGLFDRPASGGAIEAQRADPPIEHLTEALTGISGADWKFALKNLRDARLLAVVNRPMKFSDRHQV